MFVSIFALAIARCRLTRALRASAFLLAGALLLAGGALAGETVGRDSMKARVAPCTTCHGKEGRATNAGYFPRIAGKPVGYLFHQLVNFREERRVQAQMNYLVENLSDDYLREIAGYFSRLDFPYPPPQTTGAPRALLERGETLALHGDPARELPACAQCHGSALTGVVPSIPGLLGLPRDYLNAQLGAWKQGQRHAAAPDCMAQIADKLSPEDVSALSTWLSSQAVTDNARPAPALEHRLPIRCGDVDEGVVEPPASTPVTRGRYLALAGNCAGCHTARGHAPYAGGVALQTPFGAIYTSNLTPDEETGIGAWTADDFWLAMHEGRSRDGRLLYPAFPYPDYTLVTREDSDAIFAYLQSLAPAQRPNRAHRLRFPYNTQSALRAWRVLFFKPAVFSADETKPAEWNRGAYLVRGLGHCATCHSTRNVFGAIRKEDLLAGGLIPMQNWYAPSLASVEEAGVADWNTQDVVALLKTGVASGASVMGPMASVVYASTQYLSDADLEGIAAFLKALPSALTAHTEKESVSSDEAPIERGGKIYEKHCAQCHGDSGEGSPLRYPALVGNRAVVLPDPTNVIRAVLDGGYLPATAGNPQPYGMPPFAQMLDDSDVAAVVSWIRDAWGNAASSVTNLQVLQYR